MMKENVVWQREGNENAKTNGVYGSCGHDDDRSRVWEGDCPSGENDHRDIREEYV